MPPSNPAPTISMAAHGNFCEMTSSMDGTGSSPPSSPRKANIRQNQFGVSIGGPVIRNKIFFFGDYEGLRRRQGVPHTRNGSYCLERSSGYTDSSELITGQYWRCVKDIQTDLLGRHMPTGTILDPSTTRAVAGGFVRDPFGTCPAIYNYDYTLAGCNLNILPADRLDSERDCSVESVSRAH